MERLISLWKHLLLLVILITPFLGFSQVSQEWVAKYNGPGGSHDGATAMVVDSAGNVYVTGFSYAHKPNDDTEAFKDIVTIKYNTAGEQQWAVRYNGPANNADHPVGIALDSAGNVYVAGYSAGNKTDVYDSRSGYDYVTIKYGANGNEQWVASYNGPGNGEDQATAMEVDAAGNVYVTGFVYVAGLNYGANPDIDYATIKYNTDGGLQWVKRYNGPLSLRDVANALALDTAGNVYVTGSSLSDTTVTRRNSAVTIKYDTEGNEVWTAKYGAPDDTPSVYAQDLALDATGNVYVTGYSWSERDSDGLDKIDYTTLKINIDGTLSWVRFFDSSKLYGATDASRDDFARALAVDAEGNVYVTGQTGNREEDPDNAFLTIKYNTQGDILWAKPYDGPGGPQGGGGNDIALDTAGNAYVTGSITIGPEWQNTDYATLKYSPEGKQQWLMTYNGPDNYIDNATSIALDASGHVYVTGLSYLKNGDVSYLDIDTEYATIKYSQALCTPPTLSISVIPDSATYTGGDPSTILLGYGHQRVTLQASGAEQYVWSPAEGLSDTTVADPVFSPTAAGTYVFTVTGRTDSCSAEASVTITVIQSNLVGNKEWDRTFGGDSSEWFYDIQQTSDGGYILGGHTESSIGGDKSEASRGSFDYWVVKLDSTGKKEWDRTFGGNDVDRLYALQQTSDGGYILGGYSNSGISGDKTQDRHGDFEDNIDCCLDYWIVKLDAKGNKQWDRTYGGDGGDVLQSLQQTSDGGYILGGDSNSGISGDKSESFIGSPDFWIVKIDSVGNKEWDRTFGGGDEENFASIQQTNDNGYILGGGSYSGIGGDKTEASRGGYDYWILKLDSEGNKEWDRSYGGEDSDRLYAVEQTSDSGYVLGGSSSSGISGEKTETSKGESDYWIIKIDSIGNKEWDKTYGGDMSEWFSSLQGTNDRGYILGGYSESGISGDKSEAALGNYDYWVVKVDSVGNKKWDKTLGGQGEDRLHAIQQTSDEGYILGGQSDSGISADKSEPSRGGTDYWIVKLSPEEPCTPPTPSIAVIPTSDVYTGGDSTTIYLGYGPQSVRLVASGAQRYVWSPAAGLSDTTVADPVFTPTTAGTYTFTVTAYNGTCAATASVTITVVDARCGTLGRVLVCHNGRTLCLSPAATKVHLLAYPNDRLGSCGENPAAEEETTATMPLKVFPNPFGEQANVEFKLPMGENYRLELYNAWGKKLDTVANGEATAGQLVRLELKTDGLPNGIYYLRLVTSDDTQTLRLMIDK
ncbi:SBBP repeat-containing protein [Pontibacter mangrovi]|uniref:T9SS type A sorting domain-containing protein n=1 Tax=Pontibacter mangrovi TaxID=2589816 RepID=A0A501W043_9BACT|nr:SBBP repeat-containing protein [Pontibacter mangrovi]TPE43039.1 T9SS type A sorting domain-containing protein [Pontibacter mangrovi]